VLEWEWEWEVSVKREGEVEKMGLTLWLVNVVWDKKKVGR